MGQNQSHQIAPAASDDNKSNNSTSTSNEEDGEMPLYPDPQGNEYDKIDQLQAELPSMIDEESQQQVDDYIQACDNGKGPMVACFAKGEYLSMFQRKVRRNQRKFSFYTRDLLDRRRRGNGTRD
jgi:hypothetical protein